MHPMSLIKSSAFDLEKYVRGTIISRMQEKGISFSMGTPARLKWCLPQHKHSDLWHQSLEHTLFASPEQLNQILDLHNVPMTWSSRPTGFITFYIRTFSFQPYELLEVIKQVSTMGYEECQIFRTWTGLLHSADSTAVTYIRYVGKTGYSPWHRFWHDLVSTPGSLAIRFIQTTLLLYPNVIRDALVEEVSNARATCAVDDSVVDTTEQELIALLQASHKVFVPPMGSNLPVTGRCGQHGSRWPISP